MRLFDFRANHFGRFMVPLPEVELGYLERLQDVASGVAIRDAEQEVQREIKVAGSGSFAGRSMRGRPEH